MDNLQKIQNERSRMDYAERLAHYEAEKAQIPRVDRDGETYEAALRALAKKWRI